MWRQLREKNDSESVGEGWCSLLDQNSVQKNIG